MGGFHVGLLALIGLPLAVCVDSGVAKLLGWSPALTIERAAMGACVLWLVGIATASCTSRFRNWVAGSHKQLLLALAALIAGLLVGELLLRATLPNLVEKVHLRAPNTQWVSQPDPRRFPGISGTSHYTINSEGIRGPELPETGASKILCIGGSTTEQLYLDDTETWTHLLMDRLNDRMDGASDGVWVGNVGISGYSSVHHLEFMRRSDLMDHIDTIVVLMGINDLGLLLQGRGLSRLASPRWTQLRIVLLARRMWYQTMRREIEDPKGTSMDIRRALRRKGAKVDALPPHHEALDRFSERMRTMIEVCRRRGVRPVFVSQPHLFREGMSQDEASLMWGGATASGEYLTPGAMRRGLELYNAAMRNIASEVQAGFIDLSEMNGQIEYFYDDGHFNEAGARKVAELVAAWFAQNN